MLIHPDLKLESVPASLVPVLASIAEHLPSANEEELKTYQYWLYAWCAALNRLDDVKGKEGKSSDRC